MKIKCKSTTERMKVKPGDQVKTQERLRIHNIKFNYYSFQELLKRAIFNIYARIRVAKDRLQKFVEYSRNTAPFFCIDRSSDDEFLFRFKSGFIVKTIELSPQKKNYESTDLPIVPSYLWTTLSNQQSEK